MKLIYVRETTTWEIWPKVVALISKDSRIRQVSFKYHGKIVTAWESIIPGLISIE